MVENNYLETEKGRVEPENNIQKIGQVISNRTAWREIEKIPSIAPSEFDTVETIYVRGVEVFKYKTGVVAFYEKVPLTRFQKSDTFTSEFLKNLIPPMFDPQNWSYKVTLYYGEKLQEVPFGMGNPRIDNVAGSITFDHDFVENLPNTIIQLYVSFYRYEGIIGFYGSVDEETFPRRDDLPLIKSAENFDVTGRFVLRSDQSEFYSLPKGDGVYHNDPNTVVLNENFQATFDKLIQIDGGIYLPQ